MAFDRNTPFNDLPILPPETDMESKAILKKAITATALRNGLALGLTESEMRQVVLTLSRLDFYKSMTSHADPQVWQDVYHGMTEDGIPIYFKITCLTGGQPPVIQFKAK